MPASLAKLRVLALDCQATGANPSKNRLLEVGWAVTSAEAEEPSWIESSLVLSDTDEEIPKRVSRVTGLTKDDLTSSAARTPAEIWNRLVDAADNVARTNVSETCATVIHFCRFERPYLTELHQTIAPSAPFPFDILCTHEITKRLLPDLPRRGLRAVAGYFGHSVPELRRAAHHVSATAYVWHHIVERLERDLGIHTLDALQEWIAATAASQSTGRAYPMDRATRLELPHEPGVYRMRRSNGDLLYIGKARSLHSRVNSYFQKSRHHAEHTLEMLTQAKRLDVTVTNTALEAAVLESDEIKRVSPPYNVALREKDRRIAFSSVDMTETSPEPDEVHRIGPLPSENALRPMGTFADILVRGLPEAGEGTGDLGLPPEYAPDMDCLVSGLGLFEHKHSERLGKAPHLPALLALGRDLWRERLAAKKDASTGPEEEDEDDEAAEEGWTPDRFAGWLEGLCLHSSFLIRRSRWLCLLSESCLSWSNKADDKKTLVVFTGGDITRREDLFTRAPIPTPPGYSMPHRERQSAFDVGTYDRLIVVTAELRRLLSEGRKTELKLSPKASLKNEQIAKVLQWV
jgi:DNA polymerase-3 subunit epsilon